MIIDALCKIANHRHSLSREESRAVMGELLAGKATDAQVAALLVALHMKGETVEEIVGFAEAIRAAAVPLSNGDGSALDISGTEREALVDTCGTGGDASDTFQYFHRDRAHYRRRGRARGQAWQSGHHIPMRFR